ncbi:hypothetical protein J2X60_001986 [Curtobacterium sp. 320]|uniref:M15 family metallopeptidase n=1 Tax=Curtobacterium sp. 320 TaxID=2817749 RepID=UPI0028583281|nr:M15 family metallopeptidase [Curtobacterium sp. 320]MDR6573340.1 hypothetical protein [Curtobacterium sp. 320]
MQTFRFRLTGAALAATAALVILTGCATDPTDPDHRADGSTTSIRSAADESFGVGGQVVTAEDGHIADSAPITVLADTPAIANLDADLRDAVTRASEAAANEGIEVLVNSGWRSKRYQQALLDQGVEEHGSLAEARRWVNTPQRSTHVVGRAVDLGAIDDVVWMQENGREFGLCQTYENESWHYELSTTTGGECPEMLADSSAG